MLIPLIDVPALKAICNFVLPTVYDDSLSYYECICKLSDSINKLNENQKTLAKSILSLEEVVTQNTERIRTLEQKVENLENDNVKNKADIIKLKADIIKLRSDLDNLSDIVNKIHIYYYTVDNISGYGLFNTKSTIKKYKIEED